MSINMDNIDVAEQLVELQSQQAFQEDTLTTLNRVITEQQRRIEQLEMQNKEIRKVLGNLLASVENDNVNEIPPHY